MLNISKRRKICSRNKYKMMYDHSEFLERITKSLYYGNLPSIPCLSLPLTELSAELFSEGQKGKSLRRLHVEDAAEFTRNACVSPCSLVLAILYLERLKSSNPDYVLKMAPSDLFLISLMVSNKFLQDDGEEDEVFCDEWATSAGITTKALHQLEKDFLHAIDWRIFVGEEHFDSGLEWLEHQIAMRQAKSRGWFTYTDLANITNTFENISIMKCLVTVYLALSFSYLASISALMASTLILSHGSLSLLNNKALINVFGNNINFGCNKSTMFVNDRQNSSTNSENALMLEEELDIALNLDEILNSYENYKKNSYKSEIAHDNRTLDLSISIHHSSWQRLHSQTLQTLMDKIYKMEFVNVALKILRDYLKNYSNMMNASLLPDITETYFPSKQSPSHWNNRHNRYSMIWEYPEAVSIRC